MNRLVWLGLIAYSLIIAALVTRNGSLVALAIPFVLFIAAAFLDDPQPLALHAERSLSKTTASPATPIEVRLSVANRGAETREVLVEEQLPYPLKLIEGNIRRRAWLAPGEQVDLAYTVQGERCSLVWPEVQVTASDQLGLIWRKTRLPAYSRLSILPQVAHLRPIKIRPLRTRDFSGPIPSRSSGSGISFFGVRNYSLGDPLRRINWRKTARNDLDLFTNEFEQDRVADVGLILDARDQLYTRSINGPVLEGDERSALFDQAIFACASLADALLRDGNRVGLLIYGRSQDATFPGYGKVQRERILRALARARTGDNLALGSLTYLPTRFFPARSQIVMVSPLMQEDLPVLVRLRACGYQILIVSPNLPADEIVQSDSPDALELAARLTRIERVLLLRQLQRVGIQVVDWQVNESLDQALQSGLRWLPREFRVMGSAQ